MSYFATNHNKSQCYTTYLISSMIQKVVKPFSNKITLAVSQNHNSLRFRVRSCPHCELHKFVNVFIHFARPSVNPVPCTKFWPPLHQNAFGSRALPGLDGEAYSVPPDSLAGFGGGDGAREG